MAEHPLDDELPPKHHNEPDPHVPFPRLPSLCFVPPEVLADVLLAAPFESMLAFGTACGVGTDAGWCALLGDSVWYV